MIRKLIPLLILAAFLVPASLLAQISISGVADKATYNDTATLTVSTQSGYSYSATLNWQPIAVGTAVTITKPDFYELRAEATNLTNNAVTSQHLRFHVLSSERVGTEWGLPPHVPFPVIQSCSNEFVGARLRLLMPSNFPSGYEMPVIAWVVDAEEHAVRANGLLAAAGHNSIQIKRGVGSGFLASNQPPGTLNYHPIVGGLGTNKAANITTGTVWTSVSGVLAGSTVWPPQSRVRVTGNLALPAGSSLTVGAGSVVLLNAGVNITNDGALVINGRVDDPVVFMPNARSQPWGGFFMRSSSGSINATGVIFVASGANPTGGAGHRSEQCLFLVSNSPSILLSDSAAIYLAGQLGHAYNGGTFTFTRFLMQRATTGGEYTGASFTVNDSAFIECPDDTTTFVDGDNDALYLVSGAHFFTNTLFGWTKDDGIDSGGSGYGPLTYQSCWFEGTFHEGNSMSGYKDVYSRGTVYFDCGQGIEDGYNAPTGRVENCFFSMCKSGIRHGDNYPTIGNYDGRFTGTNCISIYNHRDLFGFNWHNPGGWTNSYDRFWVSNNLVSALDTNYPNNTLWNPATDGWRLSSVGGVPRAGVGFGARGNTLADFPEGLPVGLSRFCTNEITVDYTVDGTDGIHSSGTLIFPAGLTRRFIPLPGSFAGVLRVALLNPQNADVTGASAFLMQNTTSAADMTTLSPLSAAWKYLDNGSEQGTVWRGTNFNDSAWSNGIARLGFGSDANAFTIIRRYVTGTSGPQITNFYFRRAFVVTNPAAYTNILFRYQRDDGCIVYLNGIEMFRNNMTNGTIYSTNFAMTTVTPQSETARFWTNVISASLLHSGTNWVAAEVHQSTATSSDIAWECEIVGIHPPVPTRVSFSRLGTDAVLFWNDAAFGLEEADEVTGPWRAASPTNSPSAAPITGNRFFRLKK